MPDMTLPQVSVAPAPAKAAGSSARGVDAKPESASEQEFSKVLDAQTASEQDRTETESVTDQRAQRDTGEPSETAEAVPTTAAESQVAEAPAGKPLPPGGNEAMSAVAAGSVALPATPAAVDTVLSTEASASATGQPPAAALAITALPTEFAPAKSTTKPPASAKPQSVTTADALQLRAQGPWKSGATADVPESAQASVAQAVRSAVVDADGAGQPQLPVQQFGAAVRAAASAAVRSSALEAAVERLSATGAAASTSTHSGTAQIAQNVLPTDAAAMRSTLPTTAVDTPLRQPGWDQALSERVMWVANQKFQGAEIKLNPAHLGPIEVRVQLHQDQAQISFTAQHAPAREALEAALPRLREMFAANGYSQVDVNVSQHSFAEQQRQAQGFDARSSGGPRGGEDDAIVAEVPAMAGRSTPLPSGAIDLFA